MRDNIIDTIPGELRAACITAAATLAAATLDKTAECTANVALVRFNSVLGDMIRMMRPGMD